MTDPEYSWMIREHSRDGARGVVWSSPGRDVRRRREDALPTVEIKTAWRALEIVAFHA
jgi:hypothetical protein